MIIPFKGERQKSRLSGLMDPRQRREFSLSLLDGVLGVLRKAGLASHVYVVSSDRSALDSCRRAGAEPVKEDRPAGVNAAVALGMRHAREDQVMVLPADLPLLSRADVESVLRFMALPADVVVSPSRAFDGTNLLCFAAERPVPLSYDSNSFWTHLRRSSSLGYNVAVYTGAGVVFDVDTESDLRALAGLGIRSPAGELAARVIS